MNTFGKLVNIFAIIFVLILPSLCDTQNLAEAHLPHCSFGMFTIKETEADHIITPRVQPIPNGLGNSKTANILKNTFLEINRVIYQMAKSVNQEVEGLIHRCNVITNKGICDHGKLTENWSAEKADFYKTLQNITNIVITMQNLNHVTVNRAISQVKSVNSGIVPADTLQNALQGLEKSVAAIFAKVTKAYKELEVRLKQAFDIATDEVNTKIKGDLTRNELLLALNESVKILKNAEMGVFKDFHDTEVLIDGYVRSGELDAIHDLTPVLQAVPKK